MSDVTWIDFAVAVAVLGAWIAVLAVWTCHRHDHPWVIEHEAERRGRQIDREVNESHGIRWRR